MKMKKKIMSLVLALALCFTLCVPVFAAEDEMLSVEMNGFLVSTGYTKNDHYAQVVEENGKTIAYIYDVDNTIVSRFTLSEPETSVMSNARTVSVVTFTHETSYTFGPFEIYAIVHEVDLNIYSSGSFRQINGCSSHMVRRPDGVNFYTIEDTKSIVTPTNNQYPALSVVCDYAATCVIAVNITDVSDYTAAGFTSGQQIGTTVYCSKRLSNDWSITIME